MILRTTPWARSRLQDHEFRALRELTNVTAINLLAAGPKGPFTAKVTCDHYGKDECRAESYTPFRAALNALELHASRET